VSAFAGVMLARVGLRMGSRDHGDRGRRLPYFVTLGIPWSGYAYVALRDVIAAVIAGVVPALQSTGRRMERR
jgi:hypothetical protein